MRLAHKQYLHYKRYRYKNVYFRYFYRDITTQLHPAYAENEEILVS
jgi:hypothetical protein